MRHRPVFGGSLAMTLVLGLAAVHPRIATAQERITILPEAGTPVVATEVLVAAGPADEPEGKGGLSYLAARAVTTPILPVLDSLGARLSVIPQKDAVSFTLTAAPDVWEEATRTLLVSLFRDPPRSETVLKERDAVRAELLSRQSNPADAANREADAALYGRAHPWGRPTVGTPTSVAGLTVQDVDGFLKSSFTSDRAVVAVVGPVDPQTAREFLRDFVNPTGRLTADVPPIQPEGSPVRRDYNSITTWTSVSYRFPSVTDVEALRFLAQLALDELEFSPLRRSVFNARAEIDARLVAGELRFQVVTPPEEAEDWAARILDVVEEVAHESMLEDRFEARMRRYRGERLYALAEPEERARELARDLLIRGEASGLVAGLEGMTLERLRAAVAQLSAPIVLFLGPFQDEAG
jgi:predicted Zn-dependent peptidase